jgi:non-heme chloroperoxidase
MARIVSVLAIEERFADNKGIRIRYLAGGAAGPGLPVVFVPGVVDFADDYSDVFEVFEDRNLFVIELRGRGGSDAPDDGYSVAHQAGDVEAVIGTERLSRFHLMTFSRGTTAAIEVALARPERVATISIGDYRAAELGLPPAFVDQQWESRWRGKPMPERVRRHVLEGIQRESRHRHLGPDVARLGVPVLLARGGDGSLVNDQVVADYRRDIPGVEVVQIPSAGHDLFRPDRRAYPRAVLDFIARRAPGT